MADEIVIPEDLREIYDACIYVIEQGTQAACAEKKYLELILRIARAEQQIATVTVELQQARLRLPRDPLPDDAGNWTHDELLIGYLNVAGQAQELEMSLKQARAGLTAMRQDLDLWQYAHDIDCPNKVELMEARETIARLSAPVDSREMKEWFWREDGVGSYVTGTDGVEAILAARLNPPAANDEKGYGNVSK